MITERDGHVLLEVRQNISALDPDSILPWAHNGDFSQDSSNQYEKVTEALYLTMLLVDEVNQDRPDVVGRANEIIRRLEYDRETGLAVIGIRSLAQDKVREQWPHTP